MSTLFLDVETIPAQRPDILAHIAAGHMILGDEVKSAKAVDKEHRKTSLDGAFGEIVVIGWTFDDEPAQTITRALGGSEGALLTTFFDVVTERMLEHGIGIENVVAHNADFDRGFLRKRSIILDVVAPSFVAATGVKPWDRNAVWRDTMAIWCDEYRGRISLQDLCLALGVDARPGDIDGSEVWDAMLAGRVDEVAEHCRRDVDRVRACWLRMRP
jgi:hypothetical protein